MVVQTTLARGLQKSLGDLWKGDDFSDFTVVVGGISFQCHRFILSACSGFFQGLFRSRMKECHENCAKVGGMTACTFDVIINSLYKGIDGLTEDNILDVWAATSQLQIGYLIQECENFVRNNMSVDNCFTVLKHAKMHSSEKIIVHSLHFISRHFANIRDVENLFQLSYSDFYRVVESDYLAANYEDLVVDAVLKWVEYKHNVTEFSQDNDDASYISDISADTDADTYDSRNNVETADDIRTNGESEDFKSNNIAVNDKNSDADIDDINNINQKIDETNNTDAEIDVFLAFSQAAKVNNSQSEIPNGREDRKQYLLPLISACRLFVINTKYLENLVMNNMLVFSCRETYKLVIQALMYTLQVECRHDSWPKAAVHRVSSTMKHYMIFCSNGMFMAYNLYSGSVHHFTSRPDDFYTSLTLTVFDNKLYIHYGDAKRDLIVRIFVGGKWECVISTYESFCYSSALLAHGCHLYAFNTNYSIDHMDLKCGYNRFSLCYNFDRNGDAHVRFQQYIIVFCTENNNATAHCYNTETKQILTSKTSMGGTSKDLVSFSHQGDVFILQRNGSLWKIFSSDTDPVDFELIAQLWDTGEYILRGCVVYRKQMFVFCPIDQQLTSEACLASLPTVFESIKIVNVDCDSSCLPMIMDSSYLTFHT